MAVPVTQVWCVVVDHDFQHILGGAFFVEVPSNGFVFQLQGKTKGVTSPDLDHVAANRLNVWKLRNPRPAKQVKHKDYLANLKRLNEVPENQNEGDDEVAWLVEQSEEISSHFSELPPPKNRIRVLVQVPAPAGVLGKRSRAADDPELTNLPWLKEVHSKIWNRKDLKPQLFPKVKVTRDHYNELQQWLNDLHSDRNSPGYDASKSNVRSIKLKFLQSLPRAEALSPRHPDDNNDRVDDNHDSEASSEDDEINSLFPYILSFLDLSPLELKEMVPNRLPLPLLVRQEYKVITDLIECRPRNSMGSVIVSGQPGTGKIAYLHLRIIQKMMEGCPFLYQATEGIVYHVSEEGVVPIRSWPSQTSIVAFIDGDKDYAPQDFLAVNDSVQLIVASSPRSTTQKWTKQLGNRVTKFVVRLWSHEELLLTGIFLYSYDLSFELLRESTSYFGYNPRRCFEASSSDASLKDESKQVASTIRDAAGNGSDSIIQLLRKAQIGGSDISHTIFQNFPTNTDKERLLSDCQFGAVSRWALDLFLHEYDLHKDDETASFYWRLTGMAEAAPLRGHLFERQVLNHFGTISAEDTFSIRRLTDSYQEEWIHPGPIPRIPLHESTVVSQITEAVQGRRSLHLVPLARNFPAVDSILYHPKDPEAVITCIQITMNPVHPIVVSGLQRIQSWFKKDNHLKDLRPTKSRPWRFLFVVPSAMASTFELQKFVSNDPTDVWAGKVRQWVLGLEEKTIFRRSDSSVQRTIALQ